MEERLHKVLAQAGISSRRNAEEMILAGRVLVNGEVVETLGAKVDPDRDTIQVDGQAIQVEPKIYLALHKPRGYISDRDETGEHKTALDLVTNGERLFAAGRLDMDSEGLLLLTNDGDLTFRLTHPRYEHEKEYLALVVGQPDEAMYQALKRGVVYQDQVLRADRAGTADRHQSYGEAGRDQAWIWIVLHEGKKREIRHMCSALGHPVMRLVRIRIGPVELGKLKPGQSRPLTAHEIHALRQATAKLAPRPKRATLKHGPIVVSTTADAEHLPRRTPAIPRPSPAGHIPGAERIAARGVKSKTERKPGWAKPKSQRPTRPGRGRRSQRQEQHGRK